MGETALVVITALSSGLIATLVTIWWQKRSQLKRNKTEIFAILMSKRYEISAEESVDALNMIDVVFYKSPDVRTAWKTFIDATNAPESPTKEQIIRDKHLRLLEVIAEDIGYKKIHWDDIKQYYYPVGLSNKKQDEAVLRKVQIDAALAQIKGSQEQGNAAQIDAQAEQKNQMLLKVLENPDSFARLLEAATKAQNTGKNNKPK